MSALALAVHEYAQTDPDILIAEHTQLVRRLARQVHRSASSATDLEELVQTGMLPLVRKPSVRAAAMLL